jgi:hypothetical protein
LDVCPIPGDICLIAKPQITAKIPAIAPDIKPIAPDVPEASTNVRAKAAAKGAAGEHWPTCEAAVKAAAEAHSAEASIAAKGRSVSCHQRTTERSRGGKDNNRFGNHRVPPVPARKGGTNSDPCGALQG